MNYITRERIHVDRIATAWAIKNFIDPDATFQFVPRTRDVRGMDGIPFDVRGAALTHRGGRCTFLRWKRTTRVRSSILRRSSWIIWGGMGTRGARASCTMTMLRHGLAFRF